MASDSLKRRYLAKLFANLIGTAILLVIACIVPRGLGPKAYGDFQFLTDFSSRVTGFLEMGTSNCFYMKLSQRNQDFGLVSFYLSFTCLMSILFMVFVGGAFAIGANTMLWPGQIPFYIYLAAIWGILSWWIQILNKVTDAYGVTVSSEIAKTIQRGIGVVFILALFLANQLNLTNYFIYHYFILLFLGMGFIVVLERTGHIFRQSWKLSVTQIKAYTKEFYNYSHPLFVIVLFALIVGIMDRWLLQFFSGSVEQGFFGLSYRIGAICFLFTSAMTPLITREFAIAFHEKDIAEMASLFRQYVPRLYSIAAYFGCFIAVQARSVTYILGGEAFQHAMLPVMIMAFFPIHQTYGQLTGSVFYATGQTFLYRNIGITFMLVSLPVTYFLIAPPENFGLGLGATGLAIKLVVLQFINVNIRLFFNSRLLHLKFMRYLGHQFLSVGVFLTLSFFAGFAVKKA
ncbi:lipopolysaccharide biosynthesis protein, partial [Thermodesulfobacteriota bacterium]